jgi:hypothetical protein
VIGDHCFFAHRVANHAAEITNKEAQVVNMNNVGFFDGVEVPQAEGILRIIIDEVLNGIKLDFDPIPGQGLSGRGKAN